jgi:hypothetical protein
MNLHKHARFTPRGRALLIPRIEQGLRVEDAAQAAGVSVRTGHRSRRKHGYRRTALVGAGSADHPSAANQTPGEQPHVLKHAAIYRIVAPRCAKPSRLGFLLCGLQAALRHSESAPLFHCTFGSAEGCSHGAQKRAARGNRSWAFAADRPVIKRIGPCSKTASQ